MLHVIVETTSAIGRARAVAKLAALLAVAVTVDDVCKVVLRQAMVAFDGLSVSICLPSPSPSSWRMARRHRIEQLSPDEERLPLIWSELGEDMASLIAQAISRREPYLSDNGEIVAVPFRAGGNAAALVIQREAAPVPHDVVAVLAPFRELVGDALGRAVVYDAERTTAELLQRTLLPPNLPQSDAISIAARYEPVSEGTVAGGDFYDSFFLPDGRLAMVIGDVVGRGVMAATVMGQVRAAVRGAALTNSEPASVMAALDRVVWDLDALWPASMPLGSPRARPGMAFGGELFVTMLYGAVDPDTGEVVLASAGHPLPALLFGRASRHDGRPRGMLVEMPVGPPLGIEGVRPAHHLTLGIGDMLVGFTDGLLERRGEAFDEGEERLLGGAGRPAARQPPQRGAPHHGRHGAGLGTGGRLRGDRRRPLPGGPPQVRDRGPADARVGARRARLGARAADRLEGRRRRPAHHRDRDLRADHQRRPARRHRVAPHHGPRHRDRGRHGRRQRQPRASRCSPGPTPWRCGAAGCRS